MNMRAIVASLPALFAMHIGLAQTPELQQLCTAPPAASIDVASVKPSQIGIYSARSNGTADSATASGTPRNLIEAAFDLLDFEVAPTPGWTTSSTWDVIAKVDTPDPEYPKLSREQRRSQRNLRLRAALFQRFALRCHFESRTLPVYNLVVAKGGAKLNPTPPGSLARPGVDWDGEGSQNTMKGSASAISALADELSRILGRRVIDHTGLIGPYNFGLKWSSADASPNESVDSSGPTLFTALQEQLGLQLEPARGPVPVLVIDHIEQPAAN